MQSKFYIFLVLPLALIILLFVLLNYFYLYPSIEQEIVDQKKEMIKELTNVSISIISDYNNNYIDGVYSLSEAKSKAKEKIRKMSYGVDKKDYYWIIDTVPRMVMHPYRQDLEGKDLSNFEDVDGKKLFDAAVEIVKQKDQGYLEYTWQWKDDSTLLLPKLSFVKTYKDWGWIIGTGVYLNNVQNEIGTIRKEQWRIAGIIIIIFTLMAVSIILFSVRIEKNRKKTHRELVMSEEKFRNLFHNSNDIIIISDFQGKIIDINNKALTKYGFKKNDFLDKRSIDFISEQYHQAVLDRIDNLKEGDLQPIEMELHLSESRTILTEINSSVFDYNGNEAVLSIVRDITERKNIEKQLMNAILTGEENERARLAKELHDGLGPFLSTIKLYFQWLGESIDINKKKLIIDKGNENISEAISALREISNNLNPHILVNFGLMEAIKSFIKKFEENKLLEINFFPLKKLQIEYQYEIALYRIVIELLNNTLKHSGATEVIIKFGKESDSAIQMYYSDNGKGFDYSSVLKKADGLGLINIRNRIESLNGKVFFNTAPGKGMNVQIVLNL